jgi:putative aminopeptidase FrvX
MTDNSLSVLSDHLRRLTSIPALTGFEDPLVALMRDELAQRSNIVSVDRLGNVLAYFGSGDFTVLIGAHVDEIGLIVRRIAPNGYLGVERVGGVPERVLAGQRVDVLSQSGELIPGVIGTKSHHLTEQEERYRVVPVGQIYIDIGAESREDARSKGIDVGSPVTYARTFFQSNTRVYTPAIDDRVGCLVLLELADRLQEQQLPVSVVLVASVLEEYNARGIIPAGRVIMPDCMVALDVAVACDTPDLVGKTDVQLGGGPTLNTYSFHGRGTLGGVIPAPQLLARFASVAADAGIPVQRNVFFGGLTDASFLQMLGEGIPAIEIGIPTRYTHSPIESCDLRDVVATIDLVEQFIWSLSVPLDLSRGRGAIALSSGERDVSDMP